MSVCDTISVLTEFNDHLPQKNHQLNPIEQELNTLDETRSWNLFFERIQNYASTKSRNLHLKAADEIGNRWKNRYRDIIPYDETRVILQSVSTGDYINANFVYAKGVPCRRYILTQGPLSLTAGHFWQMVWEHKCSVIIMLNRFTERGILKCFEYFPVNSETLNFPDANISVACTLEVSKGSYTLRTLKIENADTKESHNVLHFHYTRWPDFGVPDYSSSMLNFLWDVRRTGQLEDPDRPCIVHCSAGVGRSGTFVLIDLALAMIEMQNSMSGVSLAQLLVELRQCRMGIIQTAQQLRYSYTAIVEGGKRLISTPPEERSTLVFAEHGDEFPFEEEESEPTDSDDDVDSEGIRGGGCEIGEQMTPKQSQENELQRGSSQCQSGYLFPADSVTSSTDEEDELEIMELFNRRMAKSQNNNYNRYNPYTRPVEIESFSKLAVDESPKMFSNSPLTESTDRSVLVEARQESPAAALPPDAFIFRDTGSDHPTEEVHQGVEELEERANEDKPPLSELEEVECVRKAALEAISQRRKARLARQAQTRARLAEISAQMKVKDMLRRRWIPMRLAYPLQRLFIQSGYVNNAYEAVLFCLGVLSFLVALGLGLWWRQ